MKDEKSELVFLRSAILIIANSRQHCLFLELYFWIMQTSLTDIFPVSLSVFPFFFFYFSLKVSGLGSVPSVFPVQNATLGDQLHTRFKASAPFFSNFPPKRAVFYHEEACPSQKICNILLTSPSRCSSHKHRTSWVTHTHTHKDMHILVLSSSSTCKVSFNFALEFKI